MVWIRTSPCHVFSTLYNNWQYSLARLTKCFCLRVATHIRCTHTRGKSRLCNLSSSSSIVQPMYAPQQSFTHQNETYVSLTSEETGTGNITTANGCQSTYCQVMHRHVF